MTSGINVFRALVIYGIGLPVAVVLGYTIASPLDWSGLALVVFCVGLLFLPLVLRWHQPILFISWNALMGLYFLPGRIPLWVFTALLSIGTLIVESTIRRRVLSYAHPLHRPLLLFLGIIIATMLVRGGIGLQVLGSGLVGGHRYLMVLGAIAGFYALSLVPIPKDERRRYIAFFFLSGITGFVGPFASHLGLPFSYLTLLFDPFEGISVSQDLSGAFRIKGLAFVGIGIIFWYLANEGIRGFVQRLSFIRVVALVVSAGCVLLSGFRTIAIEIALTIAILFFLEGLHKRRSVLVWIFGGLLSYITLFIATPHLPYPFQRALSAVPGLPVSILARTDADSTVEWRWGLWNEFAQDIPQYFWLGKGLAIRSVDMDWMSTMRKFRSDTQPWYSSYLTGEHHNGILSVLLSFGIFGFLALFWFLGAGVWVLRQNMKYGDEDLACLNRLLFAYYVIYLLMFCTYFGTLYWQLRDITGVLGFSLAMNGGVCRPQRAVTQERVEHRISPMVLASSPTQPRSER